MIDRYGLNKFSFSIVLRILFILVLLLSSTSHTVQAKPPESHDSALGEIFANDTYYPVQWALNKNNNFAAQLNVPAAWYITTGNSEIVVAVLDTGFDQSHPDLSSKNTGTGFNFVQNTTNIQDVRGHGTSVSGIIGAVSNNNLGVAGMSWNVKIMPIKVLGGDPSYNCISPNQDWVFNGIKWAADHGADIINLSLGCKVTNTAQITKWQQAVDYAYNRGILIVTGAGNGDEDLDQSFPFVPAALEHVLTVGATNRWDERCKGDNCNMTGFISGHGSRLDVMAPGSHDIETTDLVGTAGYNRAPSPSGDYAFDFGGTSAAAPFVSGLAALMLSINPYLRPDQIEDIIKRTAVPLGTSEFYGSGRIDAYQAVKCARPGDGNKDCKIDGIDYVIWLNHYDKPTSNGPFDGDFNNDGVVDGIDYVIWLNNYDG